DGIPDFFQAEDGIRDLRMSRGLGDVYKRQGLDYLVKRTDHLTCGDVLRINNGQGLSLIHI
ncbi:hypothetical protein, partial [Staphylococcus aureus]